MVSFRYNAIDSDGSPVKGTIQAEDRQGALQVLEGRGLFPTDLQARGARVAGNGGAVSPEPSRSVAAAGAGVGAAAPAEDAASPSHTAEREGEAPRRPGRIPRKDITAFTRELASLLEATIPVPAALDGLGRQEENPALRHVTLELASSVRQGNALSAAMRRYPQLFGGLYTSMVEVGEEAGALDRVLADLADLLEHEDEVRGEVLGAVAYPTFVLVMGVLTTFVLLAFVMPRLFDMLEGMVEVLPAPTRMLLAVSEFFQSRWPVLLVATAAAAAGLRWYLRSAAGALRWDGWKLRLPVLGPVLRASALGRLARTLGTLEKSGVSLLPALEIVRHTVGNRRVALGIERVAEEARGGDRLAVPLRRLGLFPPTMIQMIAVGEETGNLGNMLLRVSTIQERLVRRRSSTLISLLAPGMILIVGALVGFIVISLLLP
ncbi:MAG: type II secretion system F family protein, partial [Planctomycetota bacterium]